MAEGKFNMKNPAVKRIMQEIKEMQNNPSDDYTSLPLEDNLFEWQFAIRGPRDTEFEGGIYHGRIQLPADYPFKPPSFMFLTPNGRFEVNVKVCLSISNYHPEHWQPSWSVRTALVALIAFLPTKPNGASGSLEDPKDRRKALAVQSRAMPPKFGNTDRQRLINQIHECMLKKAPALPESCVASTEGGDQANEVATSTDNSAASDQCVTAEVDKQVIPVAVSTAEHSKVVEPRTVGNLGEVHVNDNAGSLGVNISSGSRLSTTGTQIGEEGHQVRSTSPILTQQKPSDDHMLTLLAVGLLMAIVALLVKKFLKSQWGIGA